MELRDFLEGRAGPDDYGRLLKQHVPTIGGILVVLLLVIGASSMLYRVDASDMAVVLRLGQYQDERSAGLHWKLPWPIDTVYHVPVERVQTLQFGVSHPGADRPMAAGPGPVRGEDLLVSEMLTGDLNLTHVEWVVHYKIAEPRKALFNVGSIDRVDFHAVAADEAANVNPAIPELIRNVSESVMRKLVGDMSVDAVLTFGRGKLQGDARQQIQEALNDFDAGVEIVTVNLHNTSPPAQVRDAFQEVNRALQNKERAVNQAEGERNQRIPAAKGKQEQMISEAEGYRERVVLETKGEIDAFLAKLAEYDHAPEVTTSRLYLEAMEIILSGVQGKTILDDSVQGILPFMDLQGDTTIPAAAGGR